MIIFQLALVGFIIWCMWVLASKTGNSGWSAVLLLIPILNVIYLLYLVFADWPVQIELERYKKKFGSLPNNEVIDDTNTDSSCMNCGALITKGMDTCSSCGWTYKTMK